MNFQVLEMIGNVFEVMVHLHCCFHLSSLILSLLRTVYVGMYRPFFLDLLLLLSLSHLVRAGQFRLPSFFLACGQVT